MVYGRAVETLIDAKKVWGEKVNALNYSDSRTGQNWSHYQIRSDLLQIIFTPSHSRLCLNYIKRCRR